MGIRGQNPPGRLESWECALYESLRDLMPQSFPWVIRCFNTLPSTMDAAREICAQISRGSLGIVLAAEQTEGRGRQGRSWIAPEQGFFATYVFVSGDQLSHCGGFSLVVGCVLCEMLAELNCNVGLKWPNDVIAPDGRKLCGTLVEVVNRADYICLLTGIGINIVGQPVDVEQSVSMFDLTQRSFSPLDIATRLSWGLLRAWHVFEQQGFVPFRDKWLSMAFNQGQKFTLDLGAESVVGKFCGVNDQGCLLLDTREGLREIASGHVVKME